MDLDEIIALFGKDRNAFFKAFVEHDGIYERRRLGNALNEDGLKELIKYCWNEIREGNVESYLETYQLRNNKRRSDFDESDFIFIPDIVKNILGINDTNKSRNVTNNGKNSQESSYHVIQIHWDQSLEKVLREIVEGNTDPVSFIRDHPELLWDKLGVTSFAAHMKAQEMGIIPVSVVFDDGVAERLPTYPLIEIQGYPFAEYALRTAPSIEEVTEVNAHLYFPIHRQNAHVNLPIKFKKDSKYSEKESRVLRTVAAYLLDPNLFEKERLVSDSVWRYNAPKEMDVQPRIVPVRVEDTLITQVFLPTRYCLDRGGIQTAVLNTGSEEIFLFRHKAHGTIVTF